MLNPVVSPPTTLFSKSQNKPEDIDVLLPRTHCALQ